MDEEDNGLMEQNQQQQQQQSGSEKSSQSAQQTAQKVAEHVSKKAAGKSSLMAPIAHFVMMALPFIIIAIILIGILVFLLTMPGMVMENLKALFNRVGNSIAAFFGADTTQQFEDSEIYETLDYLEQMGYDLKGFGFLTDYVTDLSDVSTDDYVLDDGAEANVEDGVIRDGSGKIIYAMSDFISTYMISDNYVYTLKNQNIVTHDPKGENWFASVLAKFTTARAKIANFFYGPIFDFFGVSDATVDFLGKGLIVLSYDTGTIGQKDKVVNTETLWNWDSVKIDANSKTLEITRNELFNFNKPLKFSLDGWTGRYGMPLEFLLSVHVATMMPDLAFDMATSFPTNINIYLHPTEKGGTGENGSATVAYKTDSGYVTTEDLNVGLTGFAGKNWFTEHIINAIDNAFLGLDEAKFMIEKGIIPPGHNPGVTCNCQSDITKVATNEYGASCNVYEEENEDGETVYFYRKYNIDAVSDSDYEKVYVDSYEEKETLISVCDECKAYLKSAIRLMNTNQDYNYEAYIPYIANVVNHWYRDVYFVEEDDLMANNENLASNGFVDYDYDYEALTKERWTLYKTHEDGDQKGQFILYFIDDSGKYTTSQSYVNSIKDKDGNSIDSSKIGTDSDGYYYYTGTSGEAIENQIPVSKMAVKIDGNEDTYTDLGWTEIAGKWTAYEENNDGSGGEYERLFPDDQIAEDDEDKEVKQKLYIDVNLFGTVVQKGEGLRTETNTLIKKMFLQNKYFKYDGTAQTAEVITALRKDNNIKYGALSEADLEKTTSITSMDSEGHQSTAQYKVSDYAGKVSLEQDSLNAFSMLENTHTLDADYIYRDFKELIIELGYYEKEELTDDTPKKLLQWIVPQIGSGGFPNRSIDKDENEYGTMIHSKGDIEANTALVLKEIRDAAPELTEPPEGAGTSDFGTNSLIKEKFDIIGKVATLNSTPISDLREIAGISEIAESTYTFTKTGTLPYDTGTKTGDLEIDGIAYEVWKQTKSTCTLYSFAFIAQAYTGESPEKYLKKSSNPEQFINKNGEGDGTNEYWPAGFLWASFENVGISGTYYAPGTSGLGELVGNALGEGKPVYFYGDLGASAGYHAIVLLGSYDSGKVLYYDPGAGDIDTFGSTSSFSTNLSSLISSHFGSKSDHKIFIPDEVPTGVKKSGGANPYTGFEGNEAVVSPVTGILLDYGTYTEESGDRVNVDMKKANQAAQADTQTPTDPTQQTQPTTETQTNANEVKDLVGFAKILVLDSDNYKKLEAYTNSSWKNNSLVSVQTTNDMNGEEKVIVRYSDDDNLKTEEDLEDWSELDKTIYGYKEFAEAYEAGGISGNIVYIDGFKAELPDEEFNSEDSEESEGAGSETASPSGEPLTIDSFKETTESNINNEPAEGEEEEGGITSLYEKDEVHKMASQKATDKLKATATVKEQASPTMYVSAGGDDLIFIKEGTVIGRTLTDRELIVDYRHDDYEKYRKSESASEEGSTETGTGAEEVEENLDAVIGNYLRIIFQDQDSVVENVEDYMKIDDGTTSSQADGFSIIGTVLGKEEWAQMAVDYATSHCSSATSSPFLSVSDMENFYQICVDKGVNPEFAFATAVGESGLSSSNGNFWGLGTPNSASSLATYGTWAVTLEAFCDTIVSYQDPSTWQYEAIMNNYNERSACTDNGGCDPNGYGKPDTMQGVQSLYSDLGKHGEEYSGSDSGGYYYMDPDIAGVTKIYATHQEFLAKCKNVGGEHASGTNVTTWENAQYTAWQVEKKIEIAKAAFGDKAGTYK